MLLKILIIIQLVCILKIWKIFFSENARQDWWTTVSDHHEMHGFTPELKRAIFLTVKNFFKYTIFAPLYLIHGWFQDNFHTWYQDLRDNDRDKEQYWIHNRGDISYKSGKNLNSLRHKKLIYYSFVLKKKWKQFRLALQLDVNRGENELLFNVSLGYVTLYLGFYPSMKGHNDRSYGFYISEWNVSWNWNQKKWESGSNDKWYNRSYFNIIDKVFGRALSVTDNEMKWEDQWFELRGKKYCMNLMEITKRRHFRSRIPFALFHRTTYGLNFQIKKPPMHNDRKWGGDDGTYGLGTWIENYVRPDNSYATAVRKEWASKILYDYYITNVLRDIERYGRASDDKELPASVTNYWFIGDEPITTTESNSDQMGVTNGQETIH